MLKKRVKGEYRNFKIITPLLWGIGPESLHKQHFFAHPLTIHILFGKVLKNLTLSPVFVTFQTGYKQSACWTLQNGQNTKLQQKPDV